MQNTKASPSVEHLKIKNNKLHKNNLYYLPERVPTPMTRVSTIVSKVIVGPKTAIPLAILFLISSWFEALKADWANMAAFDKSISSRKKNNASLKPCKIKNKQIWHYLTYFKSETSIRNKFNTVEVNIKLENTVNNPAIPKTNYFYFFS